MPKLPPVTRKASTKERRRSPRVHHVVPVQLDWATKTGEYVEVDAQTEIVSAHGALLVLSSDPLPAAELRVHNVETGATEQAAVVSISSDKKRRTRMAITFSAPNPGFWGDGIPPPYSEKE